MALADNLSIDSEGAHSGWSTTGVGQPTVCFDVWMYGDVCGRIREDLPMPRWSPGFSTWCSDRGREDRGGFRAVLGELIEGTQVPTC